MQLPPGTWPAPVADCCTAPPPPGIQNKCLLTDKATIVCRVLGDWVGGGETHTLHPQRSLSHPLTQCLNAQQNAGCGRFPLQSRRKESDAYRALTPAARSIPNIQRDRAIKTLGS